MWDKEDLRAIIHETWHAVHHILESRWIEDEETFCYLLDFIVIKYKIKLDKILSNISKNNKKLWKNSNKNI